MVENARIPEAPKSIEVDRLRTELARVRPVVDAARAFITHEGHISKWVALGDAVAGLDGPADAQFEQLRRDAASCRGPAAPTPQPADEPGTPVFGTDPGDPFRLEKWAALADDVCMFAGCNASETDQRGPVWLRGGGMAKACTEHWEPIMRVIGEQASWERDAMRSAPARRTEETP